MLRFIQPGVVTLIGVALVVYGCVHIANQFPQTEVFYAAWQSLPHVWTILIFLLGLVAVIVGIALAVTGVRGVSRRLTEISQVFGGHRRMDPEEDYYDQPAYR